MNDCCHHNETKPLIDIKNLCIRYNNTSALDGLNLQIKQGLITAIVGPSGSGKSSFLLSLNRLTDHIPKCQVSGTVHIDDLDVYSKNTDIVALRRCVGTLFQRPNPFPLSIWKNLELPLKEHGTTGKDEIENKIVTTLKDVGLWDEVKDRLRRSALNLSGGQQQRLCLARALVLKPQILLMDEPCSALDPLSTEIVEDLILRMRGNYTIIIVTHNLMQAKRISDEAILFWTQEGAGHLVEKDTSEKFFTSPTNPLTIAYVNGLKG